MNQFKPKCHAVFGLPLEFSIADVPRSFQGNPLPALDKVVATTLSASLDTGCHGVQLVPTFEKNTVTCTIELYRVDGGDQLVRSWDVTESNMATLFAGNLEHVDLEGKPIKVKVVTPVGGWVSVSVHKTY